MFHYPMAKIPEWVIILLALLSAISVYRYFGGRARVLARLWVAMFYVLIWSDYGNLPTDDLAALSRYGLVILFLSDIVPAIITRYKSYRIGGKHDMG
jgi:hypothetical protein